MQIPTRTSWRRYVALGDSFTEGLSDPDPARPGEYRGWADRLAEHLAAHAAAQHDGDVEYANLAVRGRLLRQVVDEQVPVALEAAPDLVSLVAGGNDLMRPGADPDELTATLERAVLRFREIGADVLLATGVDPRHTRPTRGIAGQRWPRPPHSASRCPAPTGSPRCPRSRHARCGRRSARRSPGCAASSPRGSDAGSAAGPAATDASPSAPSR